MVKSRTHSVFVFLLISSIFLGFASEKSVLNNLHPTEWLELTIEDIPGGKATPDKFKNAEKLVIHTEEQYLIYDYSFVISPHSGQACMTKVLGFKLNTTVKKLLANLKPGDLINVSANAKGTDGKPLKVHGTIYQIVKE